MATSVPSTQPSRLVPEDLRHFTLDTQVEHNLLDLDLVWSEEEILNAMRRCAMMYNGIEPISGSLNVNPLALPSRYVFLVGSAYQMYLTTLQKYQRNDMSYTSGDVKADIFGKRIENFTKMVNFLRDEFKEYAKSEKTNRNLSNAYGSIG